MKSISLLKFCSVILFVLIAVASSNAFPKYGVPKTAARGAAAEQTEKEAAQVGIENKAPEIHALSVAPRNSPAEPEKSAKHDYTEKEKKLIARVVYAESRGEPFEG